ncbi:MAG: 4-demethylwyosine synthase TYW1 [Thermoprotei archaeon ex4572_64]|nr:MAG: 4-demethylwyosine synthase TYW1 [Thermoprotei archaeon ex4572_64]
MLSIESCRFHALSDGKLRLTLDVEALLKKAGYGVYKHATVELCHWTRRALTEKRHCYKVKFYTAPFGGSHRCVEFSPVGMICHNKCIYCWRVTDTYDYFIPEKNEVLEPEELVQGILKERRRLLSGYFGHRKCSREKVLEALEPTHWAISLSGEPTLYPKLPELILYLRTLPNTRSIFLVTNGRCPDMLEKLDHEDALPTQLYLSLTAPNEELYYKIHRPVLEAKNAWKIFNKSLELLSTLRTRTVIRLTLIKNINTDDKYIKEFAELVRKANPHFIEIKSYMSLGYSLHYLSRENMMRHEEVKEWSRRFLREVNKDFKHFEYMDEQLDSRIVVLRSIKRKIDRYIKEVKPRVEN